jgi:hypothetical protein
MPVTEHDIYVLLGLYLLMGIIQKPTLQKYFSRKRILPTPGFCDVILRERFLTFCRQNKENYVGPEKFTKYFLPCCT